MGMARCYGGLRALLVSLCAVFLTCGAGVCALSVWALADNLGGEGARGGLGVVAAWGALLAVGAGLALRGGGGAAAVGAAVLLLGAGGGAAGAACWGATHLPALRSALHARLSHVVGHYSATDLSADHRLLDALQQGLRCCGADGVRDWRASRYSLSDAPETTDTTALDLTVLADAAHYRVPPSCCLEEGSAECEEARRVPAGSGGGAGLYAGGCAEAAWSRLAQWGRWVAAAGAALLLALCVALLLQLVLCLHARPALDKQLSHSLARH